MMSSIVVARPVEVFGRLRSLGLDPDVLVTAVRRGTSARLACEGFHPPSAPGFFAYAEEVVALREQLVPRGWEIDNTSNFCTVVDPSRKHAIAVAAGDVATGDPDPAAQPSTQYPKGPLTVAAVELNQVVFEFASRRPLPMRENGAVETWFLLAYATALEVRAELSLPMTVNEAGYVTRWRCRIILPTIPLDGTFDIERRRHAQEANDDNGAIDIDVRKKA